MKILMIMDPSILVPPKGYGGHERLVYMFAREYSRLGHEVHLLVTRGSVVEGCTVHPFGKEGFPPKKWDARLAIPTAWKFLWNYRNEFDLVHNFGRLAYLFPILNNRVRKIMTYGREISNRNITLINKLPNKNLVFTGCSNDLISRIQAGDKWKAVYNAIDFSKYSLKEHLEQDAPLMFLGRVEKIKGAHTAIRVAKATSNNLIIAGNISTLVEDQEYFEKEIRPQLDGIQIKYVGAVNDEQKNVYLGQAKALLFPIEWNEPFGMVMVEAMACGTPVIGFDKGSVPEVVEEGITGNIVVNEYEMINAVEHILSIDRSACRTFAQNKFDVPVIAKNYLDLFNYE